MRLFRNLFVGIVADAAVFPCLNAMPRMQEWLAWKVLYPDMQRSHDGPETGIGSKLSWASQRRDVGTGTQIITASVENERVETDLDFGPMGTVVAWFALDPNGDATDVTWGFTGDRGNSPMDRYFGLMMDGMLGRHDEAGLAKQKTLAEAG